MGLWAHEAALSTGLPVLVNGISLPFAGVLEFVRDEEYMDCRYQKLSCGYKLCIVGVLCCTNKPGVAREGEGSPLI